MPAERLAHGYRWEANNWTEEPLLGDGAFGAMGGMLMSLRDLSRYVVFQMSAWPPRNDADQGPVRRATLREMQQVHRSAPSAAMYNAASAKLQLNSGGYGFGLRISELCEVRHMVTHGGGLPGFGSSMLWLPEYGVGVISLGNLTYRGGGEVAGRALEAMSNTGGLQPRVVQPSPALVDAREAVSRLMREWQDETAESIAAENLYLDDSKTSRQRRFDELRTEHGACVPDGPIDAENALRGRWQMRCDRGTLRVSLTLAPTMPPKVQFLDIRPIGAGDRASRGACQQ